MRQAQPRPPYHLVGYSYGAIIAFEMACQLQAQLGADAVQSFTLLDGSVQYMMAYRKMYRKNYNVMTENLANNPFFESELLCSLTLRFTTTLDYRKMRLECMSAPNWRQRREIAVRNMMLSRLFASTETAEWACDSLIAKFLCADKLVRVFIREFRILIKSEYRYSPTYKFAGNATLIRASQGAAREEDVGADYGLGEVGG